MEAATDRISIVVPYRPDGAHRDRNWSWLRARHQLYGWEIVEHDPAGHFSRAAGINGAVHRATGDILVVIDADVFVTPDVLCAAVIEARNGSWVVPHRKVHRLSEHATSELLAGADLPAVIELPDAYDQKPYTGHIGGGLVVVPAELLRAILFDERFVDWGQEDDAWSAAMHTFFGEPVRGDAPLWHLWHPHPQRGTRRYGSTANRKLWQRYLARVHRPEQMRTLIEEAVEVRDAREAERAGRPCPAPVA